MQSRPAWSWTANLMMLFSILVVCFGIPATFILSGRFSSRLESAGLHLNPNFAGGYPIAEFSGFEPVIREVPAGGEPSAIRRALALRRFSIGKVEFRKWSGMGIAPRLNLGFEFAGLLPDPHDSPQKFSLTVIHVYLRTPRSEPRPASSDKSARANFVGPTWTYQVIIDGLHDQARVYDCRGTLVAHGLGLYVDHEKTPAEKRNDGKESQAVTRITAALPMELFGDPAKGTWQYYVLVGLIDSRHPSMMLHSTANGGLGAFCGSSAQEPKPGERPVLRPLVVSNPI